MIKSITEKWFMDLIYPRQEDIDNLCNLLQNPDNVIDTIWIYEKTNRNVKNLNNLFEILKTNNQVKELMINDLMLTDLKSICEMLKTNKSIVSITLQNDDIKDITPFIDVILNNNILQEINLKDNYISAEDIKKLDEAALKATRSLTITY